MPASFCGNIFLSQRKVELVRVHGKLAKYCHKRCCKGLECGGEVYIFKQENNLKHASTVMLQWNVMVDPVKFAYSN